MRAQGNFIVTEPKSSNLPTLSHVINDDCSLISKFVEEYLYPPTMASGTTSVFPGKEIQDHGNSTSMGI